MKGKDRLSNEHRNRDEREDEALVGGGDCARIGAEAKDERLSSTLSHVTKNTNSREHRARSEDREHIEDVPDGFS